MRKHNKATPKHKLLRKMMDTHGLTVEDVSKITGRTTGRVYHWLSEATRWPIPDHMLRLIELEGKTKRRE